MQSVIREQWTLYSVQSRRIESSRVLHIHFVDLHKLQRQTHNAQQLHIIEDTLTYSTNEMWWMLYETIAQHNGKLDTRISHCVIAVGFVIIIMPVHSVKCAQHNGWPVFVNRIWYERIMLPATERRRKISDLQQHHSKLTHGSQQNAGQLKCVSFWMPNKIVCVGCIRKTAILMRSVLWFVAWGVCVCDALKMANPIIIWLLAHCLYVI